MNHAQCPELEQLFTELADGSGPALEHARTCLHCSAVLEEHRQLEKDLFRLADPAPPPDFVHQVMARVAATPAPVRSEVKVGLSILCLTLAAAVLSFVAFDGNLGVLGVRLAGTLVFVREFFTAASSALAALWKTAAMPVTAGMAIMLFTALFGLGRLANSNLSRARV